MTNPVQDTADQMMTASNDALDRLIADARRVAERSAPTPAWAVLAMTKTAAPTSHVLAAAVLRLAGLEETP